MAMNTKSVRELTAKFGLPVFTELHGDTVELVYNCRPHLYNSVRDGIEYKPNEFDRVGQWSTRVEMVGLLTVGDSLVGIRHRNDYEGDKTRSVREEKSVGITATIIGAVLGVAALVTTVILVAD